jgi:hypothetical protein
MLANSCPSTEEIVRDTIGARRQDNHPGNNRGLAYYWISLAAQSLARRRVCRPIDALKTSNPYKSLHKHRQTMKKDSSLNADITSHF